LHLLLTIAVGARQTIASALNGRLQLLQGVGHSENSRGIASIKPTRTQRLLSEKLEKSRMALFKSLTRPLTLNAGIGILIAKVVVKARIIKSAAAATETICAKIVAIKTVVAIESWIKCWIESMVKPMSECQIKARIKPSLID
jgi:hypothetical protein